MTVLSENWKIEKDHYIRKIRKKYYRFRLKRLMPCDLIYDKDMLEKTLQTKELIIQPRYGGLGDHLQYSSLPELLRKQKGIKTLISNKSVYRNNGIRDFVWGNNPYIKFTGRKGWYINNPVEINFDTWDEYVQKLFELEGDGNPKIYYEPGSIAGIKGKTVVDFSFGPSGIANGYCERDFQSKLVGFIRDNIGDFVLVSYKQSVFSKELEEKILRELKPSCYCAGFIEELANVLYSAKERYLFYSGAASLSAALGLPSEVICNKRAEPHFKYKVNTYISLMKENCPYELSPKSYDPS